MTAPWLVPAFLLLIGYLLGSIPFGLLLTKATGAGDLRKIGSGNIGATNVLRTGRKGLAAATLLFDLAKGAAAVLIGDWMIGGGGAMAGAMAFIGHCYPVWLRFAGGKGVATMMGVVTALYWPAGIVFALVWLGTLFGTRWSSVGGMSAAVSAPIAMAVMGRFDIVPVTLALALIVLWRHRANIARLAKGAEPKVGASRG
ncbi:glycerol-3-phosphate acyltransferase PlsY [Sphingobium wenxiniae]|uniref:Glycerol-3-phosphate acyltransferase n=1 Tax=Sphingobium wenxiniae (strain DSM 21828 / CGMCC 1.7748 / JZ-1) TaxID=595605 RepID=A0A562KQ96_SPHWJ|nr:MULTISPECIES: glycerol-3-phosphate 1-O-acyltransferase PlsY [Sphingobium]MBB6190131.1 glycerol-3-phosphate acyltransferase PlsY [Sphingobium wenxiniae]TWH97554.1 acyl-phosphate glycerol-3-phosphate acyltransferase [Sphingobium wenxiniae]WRD77401.1 glycerol-3-phosphate 1-O-acyltransferase PlsY [Sphingobium baderi]